MKYKLLSVRGEDFCECNIGDYIQALASSQFLPSLDGFVNREELNNYDGEECKVIMNAWYIHNSNQWPPSEKINPLFVAVHLNSSVVDKLLSNEGVEYLKRYAPIGCRDYYTMEKLKSYGVDAYFSACMTLTLGLSFSSKQKDEKCYFVDPSFKTERKFGVLLINFFYLIFHWNKINKIAVKYPKKQSYFKKRFGLVAFYRAYKRYFTEKTLLEAEYICQQNEDYKNKFKTDKERLKEAERLVKLYARAKLVVTSRIHCALPCLGLETPVIFTDLATKKHADTCRFGGLIELFNVLDWSETKLVPKFNFNGKFSKDNTPKNKETWKDYAADLIKLCKNFIIKDSVYENCSYHNI